MPVLELVLAALVVEDREAPRALHPEVPLLHDVLGQLAEGERQRQPRADEEVLGDARERELQEDLAY